MAVHPSSLDRLRSALSAHLSSVSGGSQLAMSLANEMASCWARGERPLAEEFLGREAGLGEQPEVALQVIYEEILLRQEHDAGGASEVMARFPQWHEQLGTLLECHHLLTPSPPPPLPAPGEMLGEFFLLAELGRGAVGPVFLAVQPALASRPVVLKVTPRAGREHLSLARVQHTHIVPLYTVCEDPARDLRLLCMPYFGGASLARLLELLKEIPVGRRTGRHLLDALDAVQADSPVPVLARGPCRGRLACGDFAQGMCWIAACLADALHYAHQRDLVHLDLKPANVLLAADGTPMLLDFHLARSPLLPGAAARGWLGGTPIYMAPEQARAVKALERGEAVPLAVDGRADVYALGLMLHQALGGPPSADLTRHNPQVSRGLADIIGRCLAPDPQRRYPDAAALASDLRRHLNHEPLRGVANRSLAERVRKWRHRQPNALLVAAAALACLGVLTLAGDHVRRQYAEPGSLLREGMELARRGEPARAEEVLERARQLALELPWSKGMQGEIAQELAGVQQSLAASRQREITQELHVLVERIRFASAAEAPLPREQAAELSKRCQAIWDARHRLLEPGSPAEQLRADLLDVAVIGSQLRVQLAQPKDEQAVRRDALAVLDEAEALCGPSALLDRERARLGRAGSVVRPPQTAWEHLLLGRSLLQAGELARASELLAEAVERSPGGFWGHFYHGLCAYRLGWHALAAERFGACVALSPATAACYHNRALAREALGDLDSATADYTRALKLDPGLVAAALNRGALHLRQGRHAQARRDLEYALARGARTEARVLLSHLERLERPR